MYDVPLLNPEILQEVAGGVITQLPVPGLAFTV